MEIRCRMAKGGHQVAETDMMHLPYQVDIAPERIVAIRMEEEVVGSHRDYPTILHFYGYHPGDQEFFEEARGEFFHPVFGKPFASSSIFLAKTGAGESTVSFGESRHFILRAIKPDYISEDSAEDIVLQRFATLFFKEFPFCHDNALKCHGVIPLVAINVSLASCAIGAELLQFTPCL